MTENGCFPVWFWFPFTTDSRALHPAAFRRTKDHKCRCARTQHSKAQTAVLVDTLVGILQDTLANGDSVQLIGFGSFSVTDRPAREGRNPATGEVLTIPAKKVVKFKPGKALANLVAKKS